MTVTLDNWDNKHAVSCY